MKTHILSWASAAMLLFNVITLQAQTTWTVDNTTGAGAQFTDVQSAINAASDGDTIYVQHSITPYSGTNGAPIMVDKQLTIVGRSHFDNNFVTTTSQIVLTNGSSGTLLKGLYIAGGGVDTQVDPMISNAVISNITIQDCRLNGSRFGANNSQIPYTVSGINISGCDTGGLTIASFAQNITIKNNLINGISVSKADEIVLSNNIIYLSSVGQIITNSDSINTLVVFDNVFYSSSPNVNNFAISGNYQLNNCLLYSQGSTTAMNVTSSNNAATQNILNCIFNQDPLFANPATYFSPAVPLNNLPDFTVGAGSPLIGAGVNGGDIGFETGFIFKYLGNPKGYPEVKVTNYTGATSSNGTVTFDIEARSH
ncbi:hypothetical protein [Nonlabens sp. Asnod3-A02]|uniref:hypothetical protein n=1 Tax=Nonlabens sp. Asnod3-A02 TaxID=3160579 RepID=UPI0038670049